MTEKFKSITLMFLSGIGSFSLVVLNSGCSRKSVHITTEESIVSVQAGERLLLRYRYKNVPFKPYIEQLFSPGGVNVLRDAPADHLHHHGLMFAVAVNGVNFWEESQTSGRQLHRCIADTRVSKRGDIPLSSFTEQIDWVDTSGRELLLRERRTIEIRQEKQPAVTLLTWQSEFESASGRKSATFGGNPYFGLGIRFLKSMDTGGQFRNSDGKTGVDGTNNIQAEWCAYTASANGKTVTIAMFDHPNNERHPATWFTMTEPFAYLSATLNLHNEHLKIRQLVLRYGVALWDGQVEAEQIEQFYQRWVGRASASIKK